MNKSILWLIGLLFVTSLSIVSCSETDGTGKSVISGILTPLLQWRKPIKAMEKGNGKSSVPINFHLWD